MYTHTHMYTYVFFADVHSMLNLLKKGYKMVYSRFYFQKNKPASSYMCAYVCESALSKEKGGEGHKGWLRVGVGWSGEMISFAFMYHVVCPFTC